MTLLVAGPEVEAQCRQLGMPLAAPLAEGWALPTKPRCLHLKKGPQGFGFLLREEKGLDGRPGEWESQRRGGKVCLGGGHTCAQNTPALSLLQRPLGSVPPLACSGLGWRSG